MDSITASNISEMLNENLKELNTNNNSYMDTIKNLFNNNPKLIWIIAFVLLSIVTVVYIFSSLKNTKPQSMDNTKEKLQYDQLQREHLREQLQRDNLQRDNLREQNEKLLQQKLMEQENINRELLERQQKLEEMYNDNRVVESIATDDDLNIEQEPPYDHNDIIHRIEHMDTDSETMENENIRELNLSTKEMEEINEYLFN